MVVGGLDSGGYEVCDRTCGRAQGGMLSSRSCSAFWTPCGARETSIFH